ncbi:MAG TPA: DUF885 family protein [Albitalea sp.]|uniref:DUF885 domain-containing protein n=1 Tax=Piscinibacter sp. TaxID=1903157 RepID=UPI002ED55CBC
MLNPIRRRRLLQAFLGSLATPLLAAPAANTPLGALADQAFDALLDDSPFWASMLGLATPAQAAAIPEDIWPARRRSQEARQRRLLGALRRIDRRRLAEADGIAWDVLEQHLADGLAQRRFPDHLIPLSHMPGNPLFMMAAAADNALSPFATATDHERHLARLRRLPGWCDQAAANLREGVKRGIVLPTAIIERMLPMLRSLARPDVERNGLAEPLRRIPKQLPDADRQRLERAYRDVVGGQVVPAVVRLVEVVERDYLPRGRSGAGYGSLPDGAAWYAQLVRSHTTTAASPAEIHALGLAEVQRLRAEMTQVQAKFSFEGSLEDFLVWHGKRPEAKPFRTEAEVLEAYAELNRRIAPQLPKLFGRVPKAALEIRPEPELTRDTASDHYSAPALDGSRPGIFYAVITDPAQYPVARMASLFLHEGQPGHHYQTALTQELPLMRFQRHYFHDAHGEGWALYAETLGKPLGVYDDPGPWLGHLSYAMLRAVRLVVDTGLHAQDWSRERAIQYLAAHTGFPERDARAQIERYMVSPGQALSYAIGRMKIESLRDKARAALGERFSLPAFHDQVLGSGSLPLGVLEAKIDRWIEKSKG